jgi:fermentation-respiration switch protein FrsA (DUF1100 family)
MSNATSHTTHVERVHFASSGVELAGNLHLPTAAAPVPAVVVTGTWTSVKEQMADRYAAALAARGYAALSFDFTGFGDSAGEPRDYESPTLKVRDIYNAVTFLSCRPDVDQERLAALGVCASAGYTSVNTVGDARIKALALVAPWLHNADIVEDIYDGADGVARRLEAGRAARVLFDRTRELQYVPAVAGDDPNAAMPWNIDFYLNPERGGIAKWPNRFAVMSWIDWLTFDPIGVARRVEVPTVMVHSEDAAIPQGAHAFFDQVPASKQEHWLSGDQFDFYDGESHVTQATDLVANFFNSQLGTTTP